MTTEAAPITREELVALVARAHHGAPYTECKQAGAELAAQSKLPKLIAENLGAGFGQWTFFPDAAEIVDFACAYAPPTTPDEVWALARTWAADDAASKHTVLALIGRDLLQTELRRIAVPELNAFFSERGATALATRERLGLEMPKQKSREPAPESAPKKVAEPKPVRAPIKVTPVERNADGTMKMPKPIPTRAKQEAPPAPRWFAHPKFGEGLLERVDGAGDDAKLTLKFESGTKTLQAKFVTEVFK